MLSKLDTFNRTKLNWNMVWYFKSNFSLATFNRTKLNWNPNATAPPAGNPGLLIAQNWIEIPAYYSCLQLMKHLLIAQNWIEIKPHLHIRWNLIPFNRTKLNWNLLRQYFPKLRFSFNRTKLNWNAKLRVIRFYSFLF